MARKTVVQIECSRCHREENLDPEEKVDRFFSASFGGKTYELPDLCTNCLAVVGKAVETITKEMEKASPVRAAKAPAVKDAPPSAAPPKEGEVAKKKGHDGPPPATAPRAAAR